MRWPWARGKASASNGAQGVSSTAMHRGFRPGTVMKEAVAVPPLMIRSRTRPPFSTCTTSGSVRVRRLARKAS